MVQLDTTTTGATSTTGSSTSALDTLTSIFQDFDSKMDTYIKKTPRIPTAQEFLADFENAFNTELSNLVGAGGVGTLEADFARNVLMPQIYSLYTGELGKIAKTGQSPFTTAPGGKSFQTTRSNGTETSAGGTSSSTTGSQTGTDSDGNSSTTNVDDQKTESTDSTKDISQTENTTVEEDILVPKLMPSDFMKNLLTPANIKSAYEGSRRGAGSFQSAGTGTVSTRRI